MSQKSSYSQSNANAPGLSALFIIPSPSLLLLLPGYRDDKPVDAGQPDHSPLSSPFSLLLSSLPTIRNQGVKKRVKNVVVISRLAERANREERRELMWKEEEKERGCINVSSLQDKKRTAMQNALIDETEKKVFV
jgi:hypothetical protein